MNVKKNMKFEYGNRQKTLKAYLAGLTGSILLTLLAFGMVWNGSLSAVSVYTAISLFAIVQLVVQSACFMRLNATHAGCWNLLPFLFVIMMITFLVGGSLWIMYNLDFNMLLSLDNLSDF